MERGEFSSGEDLAGSALILPEPVRGASEGIDPDRLEAHQRAGVEGIELEVHLEPGCVVLQPPGEVACQLVRALQPKEIR